MKQMLLTDREFAALAVPASKEQMLFRYLVGKLYGSQKELLYEQRRAEGKLNQAYNTLEKVDFPWHRVSIPIAEEVGINRTTVEKHGAFSLALDKIGEMEPSLFRAILAGTANFTRKEIFEIVYCKI